MKPVEIASWIKPPNGVLKQNFDGSFIKEEQRGGYGRVFRDSLGHMSCRYSGPVDCIDANGAEVFDMLMGYRELRKIEGHHAMIEGDFFHSGVWGALHILGNKRTEWRRFNKFQSIELHFYHVPREANVLADHLARERAFI